MRPIKLTVIILACALMIACIAYLGRVLYRKLPGQTESPLKAISENTALLIQINRPSEISGDVLGSNLLWKKLRVIPFISALNNDLLKIDSLVKTDKELLISTKKYPLYIAMTMVTRSSYGILFLTSVRENDGEEMVTTFLEDHFKDRISILKNQYGSSNLIRVILKGVQESFYFAVRKGVFMGSIHPELVTKAIDQLYLNIPSLTSSGFKRVQGTTGKKVDANIYLNYQLIRPFVATILQQEQADETYKINDFADWSGVDVILKKDEILINGYTTTADTGFQFLGVFIGLAPQHTGMMSIMPDNISHFKWMGFTTVQDYFRNFQFFTSRNSGYSDNLPAFEEFENRQQIVVKDYIFPWMGSELCVATALNGPDNMREDPYAIAKVNDRPLADSLLKALSGFFVRKKDSITYHNVSIRFLPFPDLIPGLFGTSFQEIRCTCYTFLGNYIVFANDALALKHIIDHFSYGKVLEKDRSFRAVSEHISDQTNLFYYFNTSRMHQGLKSLISDELNSQIEPVFDSLGKFESLTLQFTAKGNIFYTSLFIHYNPSTEAGGPLEWETNLDTNLLGIPCPVGITRRGPRSIFAFDRSYNLYLIDSTGSVTWKVPLGEKLLDQVHVVYQPGSDVARFLMNTPTRLILIEASGQYSVGFPIKLPLNATTGLTFSEADNTHDARILIPLSDNKVHAFSISGHPIRGWPDPGVNEQVSEPVQNLRSGNKNFIFIRGINGRIHVTDWKGKRIMKRGMAEKVSPLNKVYFNKANRKGLFLTSDPGGKILYFQESGRTSESTLNLFSNSHTFLYEDLANNGSPQFIFYDRNKLYYYNRQYKLTFSYLFERDLTINPFIINLPGGGSRIGAVSGTTGEIYLFGPDGIINLIPGIRGTEGFTITNLGTDPALKLIVGSGKKLKCYSLPK